MNGTNDDIASSADREPLPFLAEVQDRQRDIAMRGAEPWKAPAEQRRAARLRDMEMLRLSSLEAAFHVTEYIAGRLPAWKRAALEDIANPVAALANLNRSIVQICLAEDRFDESGEERAARIAKEAAARAKAEQAAEDQRSSAASQARKAETRCRVQQAIRAIALPTMRLVPPAGREKLFAGLFKDLDAANAYDRDPVDIIADACVRLGTPLSDPAKQFADHRERRARLVALARAHLAALDPRDDGPDGGDDGNIDLPTDLPPPFTDAVKPRGPPN